MILVQQSDFGGQKVSTISVCGYAKSVIQPIVVRCLTNDLEAVFFLLNRHVADSTLILCVEFEIVIV